MDEKASKAGTRYKSLTLFVLIAGMVGIFVLFQLKDSFFSLSNNVPVKLGAPAPNFTFPTLDGKMVSLSDYNGKVVFLNIWATWCPPCREEMPSMEKLYKELKGQEFEILAVSIDASGATAVRPFMKEHGLSFPALLDTGGTIRGLYGMTGVPETYVIDKEGVIKQRIIGPRDWAAPEAIRLFRGLVEKS
jgi:peroxiredoxin